MENFVVEALGKTHDHQNTSASQLVQVP